MNQLARLRLERGLSQQDLAEKLNTTSVSIGRYEREDQRLTLPLLRKLAKVLGASVAEIAGETSASDEHYRVPVYDLRASAGAGALAIDGPATEHLMFREQWLRKIAGDLQSQMKKRGFGDIIADDCGGTEAGDLTANLGTDGSGGARHENRPAKKLRRNAIMFQVRGGLGEQVFDQNWLTAL